MPRNPVKQLEVGRVHYAGMLPDAGVEHFGCVWHLYTLGHLVQTDLDRVARALGLSFADLEFLGMLPIEPRQAPRAIDIASSLCVSHAAVSARVTRLVKLGLIAREPAEGDRRAYVLSVTPKGRALFRQALEMIAKEANIVQFFARLTPEDKQAFTRILGLLHEDYDRLFIGTARQD